MDTPYTAFPAIRTPPNGTPALDVDIDGEVLVARRCEQRALAIGRRLARLFRRVDALSARDDWTR